MEPTLSASDAQAWRRFRRTCSRHARSLGFASRVARARECIVQFIESDPSAYVAWSAGKDSTALMHLASQCGVRRGMSIKDDLDFPGEEEYITKYSDAWGVRLDIIRPHVSLEPLFAEVEIGDDIHSRSSHLSEVGFYSLIEEYQATTGGAGVLLGLRSRESRYRAVNRVTRGLWYRKKDGFQVCQPIADWTGRDVFAYLFSNEIEPFVVYQCCATLHPEKIRKSWWVPGTAARHGYLVWLRKYWPSLYSKLVTAMPQASAYA